MALWQCHNPQEVESITEKDPDTLRLVLSLYVSDMTFLISPHQPIFRFLRLLYHLNSVAKGSNANREMYDPESEDKNRSQKISATVSYRDRGDRSVTYHLRLMCMCNG